MSKISSKLTVAVAALGLLAIMEATAEGMRDPRDSGIMIISNTNTNTDTKGVSNSSGGSNSTTTTGTSTVNSDTQIQGDADTNVPAAVADVPPENKTVNK